MSLYAQSRGKKYTSQDKNKLTGDDNKLGRYM